MNVHILVHISLADVVCGWEAKGRERSFSASSLSLIALSDQETPGDHDDDDDDELKASTSPFRLFLLFSFSRILPPLGCRGRDSVQGSLNTPQHLEGRRNDRVLTCSAHSVSEIQECECVCVCVT